MLMKHYAILLGGMAAFFLALFCLVEALHLPLLIDPGPWFTSKTLGTAFLGIGLLVADVLLPIPSSLIMIAHGLCFGFAVGALLSLVGSVGAGLVAFSLGRYGHPLLHRLIPPAEKRHADALFARWGALAILVTRPIPILAETMAILAGASPISWQRMVLATVAGSLPAALLYSLTGAVALALDRTLLAFVLVFLIALVFWWSRRQLQRGKR
jgi:uncharacterized membrane protein YdjX (TVP38/TMEM64 family)